MSSLRELLITILDDDPQAYQKVFSPNKAKPLTITKFDMGADKGQELDLPDDLELYRGLRAMTWYTVSHGKSDGEKRPKVLRIMKSKGLLKDEDADRPVVLIYQASFGENREGQAWFRVGVVVGSLGKFIVQCDFDGMSVDDLELLLNYD
ncbi:hypothetical protein SCHPADRAFT_9849 [Schizopora paradoxa]|uniref:Uncharacterized protein n=1 Tax=Schizopora paradoxa TaxID=27342 RepID=A0A0H2S9J1_9AGAM|nr:hypothetical protein SCHPADRAFT_9849 [Schizopora paradoxa]